MSEARPAAKTRKLTEPVINNRSMGILTGDLLGPIRDCVSIKDTLTLSETNETVRERLACRSMPHILRMENLGHQDEIPAMGVSLRLLIASDSTVSLPGSNDERNRPGSAGA